MSSIAEIVIREEYTRSKEHLQHLVEQLKQLPKGSIVYKRGYAYLRFREEGKKSPTDKYIKAENISLLKKEINKRKRLEMQLKNRLENIKFSMKALGIHKKEALVTEAMILIHGRRVKRD